MSKPTEPIESTTLAAPQTPPAFLKPFLTLAEAAGEIGCTRRFLETRIEDKELSVVRFSKRLVRIKRSEFNRWVEEFSTKGGAL
jgi:excisionase family DNA binding protein